MDIPSNIDVESMTEETENPYAFVRFCRLEKTPTTIIVMIIKTQFTAGI